MYDVLNNGLLYPYLTGLIQPQTDTGAILLYLGCLALCMLVGYLLGSLSPAILISRIFFRGDVREHGSGNAGTTNMLRTYGVGAALVTFFGDVFKSVLAVFSAFLIMGADWVGYGFSFSTGAHLAGLFCVIGHVLPLYYRFKGGKGVLCTASVVGCLCPWVTVLLVLIFVITVAITKYVSLGSVLGAAVYPLFYAVLTRALFGGLPLPLEMLLCAFGMMGIILWKHRGNIDRLRRGEERRLGQRTANPVVEIITEIADPPSREDDGEEP